MKKWLKVMVMLVVLLFTTKTLSPNPVPQPPPHSKNTKPLQFILVGAATIAAVVLLPEILKRKSNPETEFIREQIEFKVEEDQTVHVRAKYWLKNNLKKKNTIRLHYPLPMDECLERAECISIRTIHQNRIIKNRCETMNRYKWVFTTILEPRTTNVIEVYYKQRVLQNTFTYILTSTRKWAKPIRFAEFRIKLPQKYSLNTSTYAYSIVDGLSSDKYYKIRKTNFFPQEELKFSWSES